MFHSQTKKWGKTYSLKHKKIKQNTLTINLKILPFSTLFPHRFFKNINLNTQKIQNSLYITFKIPLFSVFPTILSLLSESEPNIHRVELKSTRELSTEW